MTIEEFKALLRAHGADRRRWPERARVSAEALLEREPAAQALLARAEESARGAESGEAKAAAPDRDSLTGQLLIAMPAMPDPRFAHSVIFMCMHDERGAMGIIVNQVVDGLDFAKLLEQVGIKDEPPKRRIAIHVGGPVESGRGFVLHSSDYGLDSTLDVNGGIRLTQSIEVLKEISRGGGPRRCLLALGYAGWGPGQLEREIKQNGWLNVAADEELIFGAAIDDKWRLALAKMGIDPTMLSSSAGRA
ncbi:MAG TPA: YqgE/AlgH family protein [Alphaproteobacteria bacterium]|jgi:putative transcriptional regulator